MLKKLRDKTCGKGKENQRKSDANINRKGRIE